MEIKSKEIVLVDIDLLMQNPKNNNVHSKDQIDRLAKLIKVHGFRVPVIVSNRTGFIVSGHGRLQAALKLGMKEIPVVYQDFESEAQEYAFLTSDNAIASWAEIDLDMVKNEILNFEDFDIELLGLENFSIVDNIGKEEKEKNIEDDKKFLLLLELKDENELRMFFDEMISREIKVTVME